jgi:transcriptional regulator with XRE-family HTH domain
MDDARIGSTIRAVRVRRRLRQEDVAARAGTSRGTVGSLERGGLSAVHVGTLRRVAFVLGLQLSIDLRSPRGDLARVVNAAHADLHEIIACHLASLPGWTWRPEVSFSIYGERGVIDILAWHAASRSLLIIELKTALLDPQELVATMGRRIRLGRRIARDLGWVPATVSAWVVVLDGSTNRRRLRQHAGLLRTAFPQDGRVVGRWLQAPDGRIAALSFWSHDAAGSVTRTAATVQRVRQPRARSSGARTSVGLGRNGPPPGPEVAATAHSAPQDGI